jgi:aspartyl protease family protein
VLERALLVGTLVAGAAVGIFWPTHKAGSAAPSSSGIEVTLERRSDKHFYADANVNGRPVHFLVDTGASETALTEDDARKIGLKVDPSKYELVGQGASGMVRGQYVQLDSIDVDGIQQSGARAVIVEGASISLLGQPFLEDVDEIVIRKGEMVLKDSSTDSVG